MGRKVKKYEKILIAWLSAYTKDWTSDEMEYQFVCDTEHHLYQVIRIGFDGDVFRHIIVFYFQIKADTGKVWLWVNNTDILVTDDLVKLGILPSDIVLGFHPTYVRPYTGFAVA